MRWNFLLVIIYILGCSPAPKHRPAAERSPSGEPIQEEFDPSVEWADGSTKLTKRDYEQLNSMDDSEFKEFIFSQASFLEISNKSYLNPSPPAVESMDDTFDGSYNCLSMDSGSDTIPKSFEYKLDFINYRTYNVNIPISFHLIFARVAVDSLEVQKQLHSQINLLNNAFSSTGIKFYIKRINYIISEEWMTAQPKILSENIDQNEKSFQEMIMDLDDPFSINIYANNLQKFNGYATFPWLSSYRTPSDCLIINSKKLLTNDPSKTLIHEMGHFFGLLHIFHDDSSKGYCEDFRSYDGCKRGDFVDDTPPQKVCHKIGCGECRNRYYSCTGGNCDGPCKTCGVPEAKENYMDYNPDNCRNNFTPGQTERVVKFLLLSRGYLTPDLSYFGSFYSRFYNR